MVTTRRQARERASRRAAGAPATPPQESDDTSSRTPRRRGVASWPAELRLLICVAGIYAAYLSWGYLQERINTVVYKSIHKGKPDAHFRYPLFMNLMQATFAGCVGFVMCWLRGLPVVAAKNIIRQHGFWPIMSRYILVSLTLALGSPLGYFSLRFISFPLFTLMKSAKLIPVMFVGLIAYGRRYRSYEYVSVALITTGICMFRYFDAKTATASASSNLAVGGMLITLNLLVDGFTNSTQDNMVGKYKLEACQLMCVMNAWGALFLLLALFNPVALPLGPLGAVPAGRGWDALQFMYDHPDVVKHLVAFGAFGALGQVFIFSTLEWFGSLILTTITVTRKLWTILLSVLSFGHVVNVKQWTGVALVFVGLGLKAYMKQSEKRKQKTKKKKKANKKKN